MEIRPLDQSEYDRAADIYADAFLDDPGWVAVGPDRRNHRHSILRRYHRTALNVIHRYGRPIYGAFTEDGLAGRGGHVRGRALSPDPLGPPRTSSPASCSRGPDRSSGA